MIIPQAVLPIIDNKTGYIVHIRLRPEHDMRTSMRPANASQMGILE